MAMRRDGDERGQGPARGTDLADGRTAYVTARRTGLLGRFVPRRIREHYVGGPGAGLADLPYAYQRRARLHDRRQTTKVNLSLATGAGAGGVFGGMPGAIAGGAGAMVGLATIEVALGVEEPPGNPAAFPLDERGVRRLDVAREFAARLVDREGPYGPEALRRHFIEHMLAEPGRAPVEVDLTGVTEIDPAFAEAAFGRLGARLSEGARARLFFVGPRAAAMRDLFEEGGTAPEAAPEEAAKTARPRTGADAPKPPPKPKPVP